MKHLKLLLLALLITLGATTAEAKPEKPKRLYMFGFAASFKDSTIYITDIQDVTGGWIDSKTKFLIDREQYSEQMRTYLAEKANQPGRVCVVFFATKKKKSEKQYVKLMKKYKTGYNIQYVSISQFKFDPVDYSQQPEEQANVGKDKKDKKSKKDKKADKPKKR